MKYDQLDSTIAAVRQRLALREDRGAPSRLGLPENLERRFGLQLRATEAAGRKTLSGYAAKYRTLSEDFNFGTQKRAVRETLEPGCFDASLRQYPDLMLLDNHNSGAILARCSNGTLDVRSDNIGLKFDASLGDSTRAAQVFQDIREGLIEGCSFGFICTDDDWNDDGVDPETGEPCSIRSVKAARLFEISVTPAPAYAATDVTAAMRSMWPAGQPMEVRSRLSGVISEEEARLRLKARVRAALLTL